jgi:hypothetical protein
MQRENKLQVLSDGYTQWETASHFEEERLGKAFRIAVCSEATGLKKTEKILTVIFCPVYTYLPLKASKKHGGETPCILNFH